MFIQNLGDCVVDENLINRRLLLAKEFYLQAKENSRKKDTVSKMMAIHNFHIAIEIVLKAIILNNNIRTDKQLNIDFESMMSEISNKISDKKFPYRQELRSLNSLRGLIQHQGIEPDYSSLEDFEIITRKFLEKVYTIYFDINFSAVSRFNLIIDTHIKELLGCAYQAIEESNFTKSAVILEGTFQLVRFSIDNFLPREGLNSSFFVTNDLNNCNLPKEIRQIHEPVVKAIEQTYERIRNSESFTAILGSGVNLYDLKRFQSQPFTLDFSITGCPIIQMKKDIIIDKNECLWSYNFLVSTILLWQNQGLEPKIQSEEHFLSAVKKLLKMD